MKPLSLEVAARSVSVTLALFLTPWATTGAMESFLLVADKDNPVASSAAPAPVTSETSTIARIKKTAKPVVETFVDTVNGNAASDLFNSGDAIAESVETLQSQQVRRQIGEVFYGSTVPYARRSREVFSRFDSGLKSAGSALERAGKGDALTQKTFQSLGGFNRTFGTGAAFDKASNVAAGAGALYGGDGVGVAQAGANTALSGASATAGAAVGKYVGGGVGMVFGGPPGAALGGVVGGVSGAVIGSYEYDSKVKPILDKTMDAVSRDLQRQEEQANRIVRRVKTDSTLLEQSGRPWVIPFEQNTRSPYPIIVRELSASQADAMHRSAEQIRDQQMVDRVQKNSADNIGDRVELLNTLRSKSDDPEATQKLAREIALLEQRLQQLPLADVLKRVDALSAMRDKAKDPQTQQKLDREIAFLNQRERPPRPTPPVSPVVSAATPLAPCTGRNEIRNSAGICLCRPGTELVLGQCQPFCPADMVRDGAGVCGCMKGYESVGGICLPACLPIEERIGNVCMARCGANEERNSQNVCVCKAGLVPTPKGCAPACGPNETRDTAGTCVCSADFERVNGQCVPFCGPGEVRAPDGSCSAANACATDSDCPAGYECGPQKVCLDKRPAGDAAVRMLQSAREGRSQPDRLQMPLLGQTATGRPERFGLNQMPGGSTQIPTPSGGTATTPPQKPQRAGPSTGPIPTCTTDRDCPGAKCVNNVCTSAPPAPPASVALATPLTPPPPATPPVAATQDNWYLFESVVSYTDEQRKRRCVSTNRWALPYRSLAEAQAFLKTLGGEVLKTVRDAHPEATLVSTRIVSEPTKTMPALPGGQGGIVSVRCQ